MTRTALALCHLRRRPGLSLLLLLGLAAGVATVVGLLAITRTMEGELGEELHAGALRVVISAPRQEWDFTYAGFPVGPGLSYRAEDLPTDTVARVEQAGGIDVVAPKLLELIPGPAGDETLAVGVDWEAERRMRTYWQVRGRYPEREDEILLGSHLADLWGTGPGGQVRLSGRAYWVAGVLEETGKEEDGVLFLSLAELRRRVSRPAGLTFVELRSAPGADPVARLKALLPGVEITPIRTEGEARLAILGQIRSMVPLVAVLAAMTGCLLVGATEAASVRDRTREVGVLRTLGYGQRDVLEIILVEVLMLGSGAAVVGYGAGISLARLLLPALDPASPPVGWHPLLGLLAWLGTLAVAVASACFPARHASRIDPVRALRFL
ncbi:MAG: ABC transporter permease [Bacillota bacterium]